MKSFRSIIIILCCFSSEVYGQGGFFWTQYAAGNPAATGVNSNLEISSVTSLTGKSIIRERINAEVRIKKLHGAIGVGYRYAQNRTYYQSSNPYLNYSFHIKTGENSLLAFGASVEFAEYKYSNGSSSAQRFSEMGYGIGAHYQFKGLKVGIAAKMYNNHYGLRYGLSDVYVDYTLKLGDNWAINAAAHAGDSRSSGGSNNGESYLQE